jgi:subtilisin family serine protease
MSLGGGASTTLDNAVSGAIGKGVTFVVAAGNGNTGGKAQPACNYSPARVPNAITVGSTTSTDARSSFSNYGTCVDVFAPGSSITSSWYTSTTATNTISGTSMASPHVAGVAALYLQGNPSASAATVANAIISTSTANKVTSAGTGSPNRLLYSLLTVPGGGGGGGGSFNYSGSLSGTGVSQWQPSTSGYTSSVSGTHTATLSGPSGTDFDLYLQKWNGSSWVDVASSTSASSTENISYSGTSGSYRWEAYSYSGSGSYTLVTTRP